MIKNIVILSTFLSAFRLFAGFQETGDFIPFNMRLSLRAVENQTLHSSFQIYYSNGESLALLMPQSTHVFESDELFLQQQENLCLKCVKGSFLPIYIKDEGRAGGKAPQGFHGPYYLSMWLNYPDVSEDQKHYVRYVIKNGQKGEFCVRINPQGGCQIIVLANMELLSSENLP